MKKFKSIKNKIILCLLALVFPLSTIGIVLSMQTPMFTNAAATYSVSYREEQTLTNNNFSSGVTNFSLNDSLSGWTGHSPTSSSYSTSGIITTGARFQDYGANRFYLRNNPKTADKDAYVLMINSKYADSPAGYETKKYYESQGTTTLDANSYYYFQVSYNSDTNYDSHKEYTKFKPITEDDYITPTQFGYIENGTSVGFNQYIRYTPKDTSVSGEYYIFKGLEKMGRQTTNDAALYQNVEKFYQDEDYFGFLLKEQQPETSITTITPVYVIRNAVETGDNGTYSIASGYELYTCPIEYDSERKEYKIKGTSVPEDEQMYYYKVETVYDSEDYPVKGSIYVKGLKDSDGNKVPCEITRISSNEWTTFYFFIATGNESQAVNFQLWLGEENGPKSSGVVFYDACHLYKCSENCFWDTYQLYKDTKTYTDHSQSKNCTTLADLREDNTLTLAQLRDEQQNDQNDNFDFEDDDLFKYWQVDSQGSYGARIFNRKSASEIFKSETNTTYVGTNLSKKAVYDDATKSYKTKDNDHVLALWADNDYTKITLKTPIDIKANEVYKIKLYYKVSEITEGSAYVSLTEDKNRILDFYSDLKDIYNYADETFSTAISTNASNYYTNNYGTIEFFVKGGPLYRSAVNLSLSLGKAQSGDTVAETATGCILFDDLSIEKSTTTEYDAATNKLELGADTKTQDKGITNGSFDLMTTTDGLPTPNSWTALSSSNGHTYYGVVNTDSTVWSSYKKLYTDEGNENYLWADLVKTNPGAIPSIYANKTNNVLMLANPTAAAQSISSTAFNLDVGFKKISFDYYISNSADLYVDLIATDGEFAIYSKKITGNNKWAHCEIPINIENTTEIYIKLSLGKNTDTQKVSGYAFFDNFVLVDDTQENFESSGQKERVDLGNFYYNLQTNNIPEDLGLVNGKNSPAYTGSTTSNPGNNQGYNGGLVKGSAFAEKDFYESYMADEVFFYIAVPNTGSYTIDSNFSLDLTGETYYKLSFQLKTFFLFETSSDTVQKDPEPEEEYKYGATIGLSGFDYMTEIKTDETGFETYSIYLHPTETTTAKLHITFSSNAYETAGSMIAYGFDLDNTVTETEYNNVQKEIDKKDYDGNSFIAKSTSENPDDSDSDTDTDTDTDTDNNTNTNSGENFNWLLIPSLITALAIVIAVIGFVLRKIKIKKIERKRNETYDRKGSLNIDTIKRNAIKERDKEVEKVKDEIKRFETELEKLETEHKQKVVNLRATDKEKVSKSTDKEFKQFAQKRTVIAERIEVLNKQIEDLQTPEHLLTLERKLYAQEDMKQRELQKASAKLNKEKQQKAKDKEESTKTTNQSSKAKKPKK